jgi:hypothetical protein
MTIENTLSYIAAPRDNRCKWWSVQLDESLSVDHLTSRLKSDYLCKNSDLELPLHSMLLESEEIHHRKERGYRVRLGVVLESENELKLSWIRPNFAIKQHIKKTDQDLMLGTGDVAACVRIALWLRRQQDMKSAFLELKAL